MQNITTMMNFVPLLAHCRRKDPFSLIGLLLMFHFHLFLCLLQPAIFGLALITLIVHQLSEGKLNHIKVDKQELIHLMKTVVGRKCMIPDGIS